MMQTKYFQLIVVFVVQMATCFAWAVELLPLTPSINRESILIDSRKPVAGNGDTASTLFLVQNLIHRGYTSTINILVDEKSEKIIRTISKNLPGFESRVLFLHETDMPAKEYSVVIRTGMPSGRVLAAGLHFTTADSPVQAGQINVNKETIFIATPIYGNTHNTASTQPLSLMNQNSQIFQLPSPGLDAASNEAGIFRDPFSLSIRDWSLVNAEDFLLKQSQLMDPALYSLFATVIQTRKNENVKYSLAYGFSIPQVKNQARDYFRSLLNSPVPIIVLTPSSFSESLQSAFTPEEINKIRVTSLKEFTESGNRLQRGHLTVVQIPNVPHQIFSTLLLASNRNGLVPLGAGDGFFTTALSLGIPFAPTTVDWNIRNIRALGRILEAEGVHQGLTKTQMENLRKVYSINPQEPVQQVHAQKLIRNEKIFKEAINQIPDFTLMFDSAIGYFRKTTPAPAGMKVFENLQRVYIGTPPINGNVN